MGAVPIDRETASCASCGSNVRTRGLLYALSMELFGTGLILRDFPRIGSVRGLGISDSNDYAALLKQKFDYRNTFYDREPRFDVTQPDERDLGAYDFVTSSEVFEHVLPPAEAAFRNACELLKPCGVLVFTVPYSIEATMAEHYPDANQFGFASVGGELVLVNRTHEGRLQVFEKPVFHYGCSGRALEMREFNETELKRMLIESGFSNSVRVYGEDVPEFGIVHAETWSLPIAARKGAPGLSGCAVRDFAEEWRDLNAKFRGEMERFNASFWFRAGRKLGLL